MVYDSDTASTSDEDGQIYYDDPEDLAYEFDEAGNVIYDDDDEYEDEDTMMEDEDDKQDYAMPVSLPILPSNVPSVFEVVQVPEARSFEDQFRHQWGPDERDLDDIPDDLRSHL